MARNGFRSPFWMSLLCLISGVGGSLSARAASERFPNYIGVRGLGMGGAQINAVNDETALLVNPAALGKLRTTYFTPIDPELEANGLAMQSLASGAGVGAVQDPQALVELLNKNPNQYFYARSNLMPSFVAQNFGIALYNLEYRAGEYNEGTQKATINWRRDTGAVLSYNFRFWEGRIKLGASTRFFNRIEVDRAQVPGNSSGLSLKDLSNEGGAVAADVGLVLSAPVRFLPSVSAVVRDVGTTDFSVGQGYFVGTPGRPNSQRQTVDVGFALFPILTNATRMTITGEFRNLQSQDERDQQDGMRRIHLGTEVNVADVIFLRAGMHQRYWTAGMEIATERLQFQFASYGQEIGDPGAIKEDRRYTGKFVFRF